ncbi:ATP-grasp domain-containing protein [Solirubrobacter sp. CPCC 204708]|uniref:ATP-grasp domain-containing protein n=1 Tax=Solirubrobacter deserti TaxID=2282478 RepID=A0ABT4RJ70_9ACTN|nr:ATP-grasp domain-containing protein [Solirubrobacter deserti]MBE2317664.1 ATP-grasp domain-containing protein [Solirubrobacter deserti]MDA0138614.1 ATP-grasp domain-containing protein [Solirubrobacter deserti]
MRVALVMTDADFYAGTGFAEAWTRALEEHGASVEGVAQVPPGWGMSGPPAYDLAVAHVLVEEVAAFAPTLAAATLLEACGVPLTNPVAAIVASADKLVTHAIWAAHGVPQPATWALDELPEWPDGPLVLKPALCDGARHIALVHSFEEARAHVRAWREDEARGGERRGTALLQEWVPEPRCVRLFATPERTSLAYEKARQPGALITHGTVYPRVYEPPVEMAALAQRMVETLGGGLMGVDVLIAEDGRLLALEANAPFGFDVTDPAQGEFVAAAALRRARVAA